MTINPRVRTRYAPSPTGRQHVGGARSALFPWLWARHSGGDFILRIEDTDQSRFREDALQDLFEMFDWMGLNFDEGPDGPHAPPNEYFQTKRAERYQEIAQQLIEKGMAYYAYERAEDLEAERIEKKAKNLPTGYERTSRFLSDEERASAEALCQAERRQPVIRFAVPLEGATTVVDAVRGEYTINNDSLEDMILLKSDGLPTYHLGHIVDDHDFGMTHVMRGVEYIPTAPLHVLIHQALGWTPPVYVHLPLIMDPSGKGKMSKRKQLDDGTVIEYMTMIHEFREAGYLPEAFVNYIATLGWSVGPDRDLASREEMIEKFEITDIKKSSAAFNYEKLLYMNGHYMRQLDIEDLAKRVTPFLEKAGLPAERERLIELLPLVQERMKLLTEAAELLDFFLADAGLPNVEELRPSKNKKEKMDIASTIGILEAAKAAIAETVWTLEGIDQSLRAKGKKMGLKAAQLFQPIRVAITGRSHAPGIFETVYHVGRENCLCRIERSINLLQENL